MIEASDLRALDRQCATLLGYTVYHYDKDYQENCYYLLMDGDWNAVISYPFRAGERKTEEEAWADVPRFSEDEGAAKLLEDAVERRGARRPYVRALWDITGCDGNDEGENIWLDEWKLIRASPSQRARAFVEVMSEKSA